MSILEKFLRNFADITATLFGQVDSNSSKNSSPIWSVIAMSIIGIIAIALFIAAIYGYFLS